MPHKVNSDSGTSKITLLDNDGKLYPINLLIVGSVGSGKTLAEEEYVRYFQEHDYTIISLSDVKDSIEQGFAGFEPTANYHLRQLNMFNCPKYAKPIKVYHPLTFNIPTDELPEINFYGINIKNLMRTDLQFLAESNENKRSIQIILETADKLKNDEGVHHLVFRAEEQTESLMNLNKGGMKYRSDKADDFFTKTKIGTEKTASEIVAYFKPFLKDYSLLPANNPHNLNIKELINDQEHYHIFTTKWIKDKRLKAFYILHLLQEIINNEHLAKHPICIVIEEIRFLTPNTSEGYIPFLAEELKDTMTRMRNMGKGFSIIATTQVYRDVHTAVIDSFNEVVLGRIASFKELEFIAKSQKLSSTDMNTIKNLDVGEFALFTKEEGVDERSLNKVRLFMPPHQHKEQGLDYFSRFKEVYPERMKIYTELIEEIRQEKERIEEGVIVLKDKENIHKKDQAKKELEKKTDNYTQYMQTLRKKLGVGKDHKETQKNKELKEKLGKIAWEKYNNEHKKLGDIAKEMGIFQKNGKPHKMHIKRLIEKYEQKNSEIIETEEENLKNEEISENEDENEDREE